MKKTLLFSFLVFLTSLTCFAQLPCGNGDISLETEQITQSLIRQYSKFNQNKRLSADPVYIAVKPHFIRTDAGVTTMSMAAFNNAIAICNKYFINAGIQFYICGTPANTPNNIDNTAAYDWTITNAQQFTLTNANNVNNAHNIYFTRSTGGSGGFSYGATQDKTYNLCFVVNHQANDNKTFPHELGHYFNLAHTFNNSAHATVARRELVTRNNAEVAPRLSANCVAEGDFVCDTPADPYVAGDVVVPGTRLPDCNTTGTGLTVVDANGDSFVPYPRNVMDYYFCSPYIFSPQQYLRMNAALAVNNVPNADATKRYTLDCAETVQTAPTGVTITPLSASVALGATISWTDNSSNETGYIIERSTSAADGFVAIGGVDAGVTSFTDATTLRGVTYYYRVKASNTKNNYNVAVPSFTTGAICGPQYSVGACLANRNINNFQVSTVSGSVLINNSNTGCSANSYGDFTSLGTTNVTAGSTCNFTMNTGGGSYYAEHIAIWIDTNNDNDFDDAGERVYQSTGDVMNMTTRINGSFTIPNLTVVGNVRLRIRSRQKGDGPITEPCGEFSTGEAEDYFLNIVQSINITSPVAAVCPPVNTFSVSFEPNFVPSGGNTYSVQMSNASSSFASPTIIGTGSGSPINVTVPLSTPIGTNYKIRVVASSPAVTGTESPIFGFGTSTASIALAGRDIIQTGQSSSAIISFTGAGPFSFTMNGSTVSGITTTTYTQSLSPTTTTTYTLSSASGGCGAATVSGNAKVSVIAYCVPIIYFNCDPAATGAKAAIDRVLIKNASNVTVLDNTSGNCSTYNFSDYTTTVAAMQARAGDAFNISCKGVTSSGGSFYQLGYSIWIDYNQDNDFADAGELVAQFARQGSVTSGSFTIAAGATVGNLRMRIRAKYAATTSDFPTDPCTDMNQGESEDYLVSIQTALPVTLSYFKAEKTPENTARLAWQTSSEQNAVAFEIWRGANLNALENIGKIAAFGQSNSPQNYQFEDISPLKNLNYYRLRQIDNEANTQDFRPISLDFSGEGSPQLIVFPNPNKGQSFTVEGSDLEKGIFLLYDSQGRNLKINTKAKSSQSYIISPVLALQEGVYVLQHQQDNKTRSVKVVVVE